MTIQPKQPYSVIFIVKTEYKLETKKNLYVQKVTNQLNSIQTSKNERLPNNLRLEEAKKRSNGRKTKKFQFFSHKIDIYTQFFFLLNLVFFLAQPAIKHLFLEIKRSIKKVMVEKRKISNFFQKTFLIITFFSDPLEL